MPTASESTTTLASSGMPTIALRRMPDIVEDLSEHGVQDNAHGVNGV